MKDIKGIATWTWIVILVIVVIIASVATYFVTRPAPSPRRQIKWVVCPRGDVSSIKDDLEIFEEEHGIDVELCPLGFEVVDTKQTMSLKAPVAEYDIVWINDDYFFKYVPYLTPLNDIMEKTEKEDYFAITYEFSSLSGYFENLGAILSDMYGEPFTSMHEGTLLLEAPFNADGFHLACRKDLFTAAGIEYPETFDELKAAAAALHNPPDVYGITMPLKERSCFYSWINFLFGAGGDIFDASMHPAFNSSEGYLALQTMIDLIDYMPPGVLAYHYKESSDLMMSGKAGMALGWIGPMVDYADPEKSTIADKYDILQMPHATGKPYCSHVGIYSWGIAKNTKEREAAGELLTWLTSDEILAKYQASGIGVPATIAAQEYYWPHASELETWKDVVLAGIEETKPLIPFPEWPECVYIINDEAQKAFLGEKDAVTATDDAAAAIAALLSAAGYYETT